MIIHLWVFALVESTYAFFKNVAISSYLFPIYCGLYLTFFTANIIRFRELIRELFEARNEIRREIELIPVGTHHEDCKVMVTYLCAKLSTLDSRLAKAGHHSASLVVFEVHTKLSNQFRQLVDKYDRDVVCMHIDADDGDDIGADIRHRTRSLKQALQLTLMRSAPSDHKAFMSLRPNLWALFDLLWCAGWSSNHLKRARIRRYRARIKRFICGECCCRDND